MKVAAGRNAFRTRGSVPAHMKNSGAYEYCTERISWASLQRQGARSAIDAKIHERQPGAQISGSGPEFRSSVKYEVDGIGIVSRV